MSRLSPEPECPLTIGPGQCGVCFCDQIRETGCLELGVRLPVKEIVIQPLALKGSARNGCQACTIISRGIEVFRELDEIEVADMHVRLGMFQSGGTLGMARDVVVRIVHNKTGIEDLSLVINFPPSKQFSNYLSGVLLILLEYIPNPFGPAYTREFKHNSIPNEVNSTEGYNFMKASISRCVETHEACTQMPFLPQRVIDVSPPEHPDRHSVVLIEPSPGFVGKYIALSHCWGRNQMFTTTTSTMEDRMKQIPIMELPLTFRDAIAVARVLDIRYIWIDSLCIIQDDEDDWSMQSSQMAAIYSNAFLTIAASSAKDGSAGLFRTREISYKAVEVQDPNHPSSVLSIMVMKSKHHQMLVYNHNLYKYWSTQKAAGTSQQTWWHESLHLPLIARAWAFQERLLSTRILHFTSLELIFECRQELSCECSTEKRQPVSWSTSVSSRADRDIRTNSGSLWYDLLGLYTARDLTYQRDIFPALSGVAEAISHKANTSGTPLGMYCAGIWDKDLITGLSWQPDRGVSGTPDDNYYAPSWSWASIRRSVNWHQASNRHETFLEDSEFQLIENKCVLKTSNKFGELKSGSHIVVKANIVRAIPFENKRSNDPFGYKLSSHDEVQDAYPIEHLSRDQPRTSVVLNFDSVDLMESNTSRLFCIELRRNPEGRVIRGLAVRKINGWKSQDTYERVGMFEGASPMFGYCLDEGSNQWEKTTAVYKHITLI